MTFNTEKVEKLLDYTFKDKDMLRVAFSHSTYAHENGSQSNERLEFLGDCVLNLVVSDFVYNKYPAAAEGLLTKIRASIVRDKSLKNAIEEHSLTDHILVGRGNRTNIVSDSVKSSLLEAVLGAIYLDGGYGAARAFALKVLASLLRDDIVEYEVTDNKSKFINYCQQQKDKQVYDFKYKGVINDNGRTIHTVELVLNGEIIAKGCGTQIKNAEQSAARLALKKLKI